MLNNKAGELNNLSDLLKAGLEYKTGITYINGNEDDKFIGYKELYHTALKVLYNLQQKGIKPGQELVFQVENNEDFINIFWACILGGIIPVPVMIGVNEEHRLKLFKIFDTLNNPCLIISGRIYSKLSEYLVNKGLAHIYARIKDRTILAEEAYKEDGAGALYKAQPSDIAFIQFSSGSTGDPKGVVLTHQNLITNMKAIINCAGILDTDSSLGWMPLTHDLGLIGFHMTPLFAGINQFIMPTAIFITQPVKWLDKAHQYRISVLASPNFGYKHFLSFFDTKSSREWDLSCIRLVFNGAEPIAASLSDEFYNTMSKWGLKKEAAFPVYGMAEACVAVSFSRAGTGLLPISVDRNYLAIGKRVKKVEAAEDKNALVFVDLGYPVDDCFVRICDDNDSEQGEDIVGNIQIRGKNVTSGYYNNPEATTRVFAPGDWLRTGDLGFISNGRLIVTGRKKDIIFINGQNYYPHDIERVAEEVEGLDTGRVAACGIYDRERQSERIGIFIFYKQGLDKFLKLASEVKSHISNATGMEVSAVVPVRKMPKTTSGKIQRYKLKEMYEAGEFTEVLENLRAIAEKETEARNIELPRDEAEEKIHSIWTQALGLKHIGINDSFFELGGDSIKAAYIVNRVYREFNVELPIKNIFEEPTIAALAEFIKNAERAEYKAIEKAAEAEYYEASPAQKRLYALCRIESSDTSYNVSQAFWLKGKLEKEQFTNACKELVRRHESLRTCFGVVDGVPIQKVLADVDVDIEYVKAEEKGIEQQITDFVKPFDLEKTPLFRMALIEAVEKHLFILDIHHIIADGTSVGILLDELLRIYDGIRLEKPLVQYKDFAVWQNKQLFGGAVNTQEQYWLKKFEKETSAREIPVLELPIDFARPSFRSFEGDKLSYKLDAELSSRLDSFARKNKTSSFMLLLSVYYILLNKYSGQEDIIVGTSTSGRLHPDLADAVGMFVNTLPLRNYPAGSKVFRDFLEEVKENTLKAFENQSYQFEMLVERLDIERDMSRNALFDTMFVMQNMKAAEAKSSLDIEILPTNNKTAKFDLSFFAWQAGENICIEIEYCTKLFKPETVCRMWEHYHNILTEVVQDPYQKLSDIKMLSQKETDRLIYKYNETDSVYTAHKTITELIEEQADKTPNNTAVIYGERKLTYKELNGKANALARILRNKGLSRNDIAVVIADRSIEFVIAVLAVLKAGGAYVPVDPVYPSERIEYMLKDSGAKLVLTQTEYMDKSSNAGEVIDIYSGKIYEGDSTNLQNINMPGDLAYVIYTSGSTGKPKGVMLEHRNLVNYINWAAKSYVKGEQLNFPLFTTISFDLTVTSIYTPLTTGNSIVVYGDDSKEVLIKNVVRDRRIGIVKATPAHLKLIMNDDNRSSCVKRFIVGGEQLDTAIASKLKESFGGMLEIYNEYGPTEATVGCMIHRYDSAEDVRASVPIGVPAENVQIYLLDKDMKPVPENVPGEIYIGGSGIARGYLGREELTAASFLPNPFIEGSRVYKTGDLAKRLPDNKLEYIGRKDQQVKIRGYRIELGEIENRLIKHSLIEQAAVVDRKDDSGEGFLAAYIVSKTDIPAIELREFLLEELPEYMVPSYFVRLNEIPLTANGKVDKNAMPEPRGLAAPDAEYIAPGDETEELFAGIWADILGVSRVGVDDNYFSLGGDSIKAIQIVSRLGQQGIDISVKDILTHQTIRQCCRHCSKNSRSKAYEQGVVAGSIGLTPVIRWFSDLQLKNPNHYNQTVLLRFKEKVDVEKLEKAITKIIEHHDGLRLNLTSTGEELYFNNEHLRNEFTIEVHDISGLHGKELTSEIERIGLALKAGFELEKSLLLKCAVINVGENEQYVLFTAHHIVVDGVSWRIILEDLYNAYTALKDSRAIAMPRKTASIKDWYNGIIDYSKSQHIKNSIEYWQSLDPSGYMLPQDRETEDWSNKNKSIINFTLDEAYTQKLLKESYRTYNTDTRDLLLTALLRTLREWTGRAESILELEGHGRDLESMDLSRTVGWFTAIYPVKLAVVSDKIEEQIKSVKEQLRSMPSNVVDYGIQKYISCDINIKPAYKPQLRFNYLGQFGSEAENELFSYSGLDTGADVSDSNDMTASIEINCMVSKGMLEFELSYNSQAFNVETMNWFSINYIDSLKQIINHVLSIDDVIFTPSDFDTVEINQEDLDMLFD